MKKEVKVVDSNKMEPIIGKTGSRLKRIITKEREGSDKITFSVSTIAGGIDIKELFQSDAVHYMVEGKSTIEWDGNKVELTDGMAIYIPAGTEIRYRAEKDHKVISVWSPAII